MQLLQVSLRTILLRRVRSALLGNDLLIALPELHVHEDAVDKAIKGGNAEEIMDKLNQYSRAAGRISGLLEAGTDTASEKLIGLLKIAGDSTSSAKAELSESGQRPVVDVTRMAREHIRSVSFETSSLIPRLQKKVSE